MWSTKKGCGGSENTVNVAEQRNGRSSSESAGADLPAVVVLHLPASRQLQLFVSEHVEERHQVPVVLVPLKVVRVPTDLTDHVLQTRVGGEHAMGALAARRGHKSESGTNGQAEQTPRPTLTVAERAETHSLMLKQAEHRQTDNRLKAAEKMPK